MLSLPNTPAIVYGSISSYKPKYFLRAFSSPREKSLLRDFTIFHYSSSSSFFSQPAISLPEQFEALIFSLNVKKLALTCDFIHLLFSVNPLSLYWNSLKCCTLNVSRFYGSVNGYQAIVCLRKPRRAVPYFSSTRTSILPLFHSSILPFFYPSIFPYCAEVECACADATIAHAPTCDYQQMSSVRYSSSGQTNRARTCHHQPHTK